MHQFREQRGIKLTKCVWSLWNCHMNYSYHCSCVTSAHSYIKQVLRPCVSVNVFCMNFCCIFLPSPQKLGKVNAFS